jgi:hypothetical protein
MPKTYSFPITATEVYDNKKLIHAIHGEIA